MAFRVLGTRHIDAINWIADLTGTPRGEIKEYVITVRVQNERGSAHGIVTNLTSAADVASHMAHALATKLENEMVNDESYPYRR